MIYYNSSARLRDAIDRIGRGFDGEDFSEIVRYLLSGVYVSDPYMCLADFDSYYNVFGDAVELYNDRDAWTKKSMINIAGAGYFSSDRSIREYAEKIWHINSVKGMN